jgi:hypothetical protein
MQSKLAYLETVLKSMDDVDTVCAGEQRRTCKRADSLKIYEKFIEREGGRVKEDASRKGGMLTCICPIGGLVCCIRACNLEEQGSLNIHCFIQNLKHDQK